MYGIKGKRAEERIEELLDAVKLSHRGDERTFEFSAGMRQRLAICRCVLHEPELLLLDEPDSNLDIEGREISRTLIGPGGGHTRVVVTHDPERFLPEADQVLRLDVDEPAAVS
jgi:ABC-type multidrug transport system ATPase subunit